MNYGPEGMEGDRVSCQGRTGTINLTPCCATATCANKGTINHNNYNQRELRIYNVTEIEPANNRLKCKGKTGKQ